MFDAYAPDFDANGQCQCPGCTAAREAAEKMALGATYGDADKGLRFNAGKVPLELIPPEWPWALALVMRAGIAKGYPPNNWMKGMEWSKCIGSMKRHTAKLEAGEWLDPETGQPHAAMAAWNALALVSYSFRGLGTNDLFPPVNLESIAK